MYSYAFKFAFFLDRKSTYNVRTLLSPESRINPIKTKKNNKSVNTTNKKSFDVRLQIAVRIDR